MDVQGHLGSGYCHSSEGHSSDGHSSEGQRGTASQTRNHTKVQRVHRRIQDFVKGGGARPSWPPGGGGGPRPAWFVMGDCFNKDCLSGHQTIVPYYSICLQQNGLSSGTVSIRTVCPGIRPSFHTTVFVYSRMVCRRGLF